MGSEAESPARVLWQAFPRPKVNITLFNRVLADEAQHMGVGKEKQIILTLDQAGWHKSELVKAELPEGLHLEFIPSHSPELQPAERLWPVINEPIANRFFESLDELEEVLVHRCQVLLQHERVNSRANLLSLVAETCDLTISI